jgi:hypothetical protein
MTNPFHFYTQSHLVLLLGKKARNPLQLLEGIKEVPGSSIYYHTHRFLQETHSLIDEPINDFAYWINNILNIKQLGESLASVDTVSYNSIKDLREEFIRILTDHILEGKYSIDAPDGNEFHFMSCKTFVLPTPYVAHNIQDFLEILEKVSTNSLYFHMFEARLRLERGDNDFSAWFEGIEQYDLARKVSNLDTYTMSLEGLRRKLMEVIRQHA